VRENLNLRDGQFSQVCIRCLLSGAVGNIFSFIDHMVAQANKTGTSKNTRNEKEKILRMTVPLYAHKQGNNNIQYTYLTIWHTKFV